MEKLRLAAMVKRVAGTGGIFAANAKAVATRVGELVCLKHDKFIGHSLEIYGEWAQNEIDRLLDYVNVGDFILDVGANVGFHALSFARKVGKTGQVWAFEPDPVNALLLRLNIVNSGMDNIVVPFDLAVSDSVGLCEFRSYPISVPENFGHAAIDTEAGEYPRATMALDSLAMKRAPALIKIDIEGHELSALEGMAEVIEQHTPVLSIEADTESEAERVSAFVCRLGYNAYDFVTDAFNSDNFAGRKKDIWDGHGKCANLLCVVPGKHAIPEDLPLRRAATVGGLGMSKVGRSLSAVYASGKVPDDALRDGDATSTPDVTALRADIRNFVGSFLRSTYGMLDPHYYGGVINSALDYLSANNIPAETAALRTFIVSGIEAFASAVTRAKDDAAKLYLLEAELQAVRSQTAELVETARNNAGTEMLEQFQAEIAKLTADLQQAQGEAEIAKATTSQLNLALARQSAVGSNEINHLKAELEAAREAHNRDLGATERELQEARAALDAAEASRSALLAEQRDVAARLAAQTLEIRRLRAVS